LQGNFH